MKPREGDKLLTPGFVPICLSSVAIWLSAMLLAPILPLYVLDRGGAAVDVGVVGAASAIASMGARLFAGRALDLWGRRGPLIGGALVNLLAMAAYLITPNVPALVVVRLLNGVGLATANLAGTAMVADLTPVRRQAEAISYFSLTAILGTALAPNLAIALMALSGWPLGGFPLVFVVGTAFAAVGLALTSNLTETNKGQRASKPAKLRLSFGDFFCRAALAPAAAGLLGMFGFGVVLNFLPLAVAERHQNVAVFFTTYAVAALACRPFTGRLSDRLGLKATTMPAIAFVVAALAMLASDISTGTMVGAGIALGIGNGTMLPALTVQAVRLAGPAARGAAIATATAAVDLGLMLASLTAGVIVEGVGYQATFAVSALVSSLAIVVLAVHPAMRKAPDCG